MSEMLLQVSGQYTGTGTNHDREEFVGQMTLYPQLGNRGTGLAFTATGITGQIYHDERTLIGYTPGGASPIAFIGANQAGYFKSGHPSL